MKALLIEDHLERQKKFFPNYKDFEEIEGLEIWTKDQAKTSIHEINSGTFILPEYLQIIMIHFTALLSEGNNYLTELCKNNSIDLVFFSGSINQTTYSNEKGQILMLNSKEFYSNRLIPFLHKVINDQNPKLLELSNSNWELSYYFLLRQLLTQKGLETDEDERDVFDEKIIKAKEILGISQEALNERNLNNDIKKIILEL